MELVSIPLDQITVGHRLREVDPDWVALIAASMAERGQDTPVQVRRTEQGFRLVAGAHRMAALREAGIPNALATVVEADEDEARLIEIDENLMRRELSELDRAGFLLERQAIYLKLHPETQHGKAPKGKSRQVGDFPMPPRFTAETADRIGLSERTVQRLLARAKALKSVRAQLAGTRWAHNGAALDALVNIEDEQDLHEVVAALTRAENPCGSVREALRACGLQQDARAEADDGLRRLVTAWGKANGPSKRAFIDALLREPAHAAIVLSAVDEHGTREAAGQERVLRAVSRRGAGS